VTARPLAIIAVLAASTIGGTHSHEDTNATKTHEASLYREFFVGLRVLRGFVANAQAQQTAAAAPAQATPGESPYRIAGRLPVRIMDLKVEPATIQPGQSVTLTWATENPTSVTIDPWDASRRGDSINSRRLSRPPTHSR